MAGFVDLHCHWVARIDDGARSEAEGIAMLRALGAAGFELVIATPHMRPGLFDNTRPDLERAFANMQPALEGARDLPVVALSSEHYFDDVVFERLLRGDGLPYPGGKAVLLEFYEIEFPAFIEHRLFDLRQRGLLPVIAHPERYRVMWRSPEKLEQLVDLGAAPLLDVAALVGKYGKEPRRCAEDLLERGLYRGACTDSHRPDDIRHAIDAMQRVEKRYGRAELEFLFKEGPREILSGIVQ